MSIASTPRKCILLLAMTLSLFATVQAQTPQQKAKDLLRKNLRASGLSQTLLDSYIVTDAYADKKTGHFMVYLQQAYLGIPVYNKIGIYVFKNDTLVDKTPDYIGRIRTAAGTKTTFSIDGVQAIHRAASHLSIPIAQEPRLLTKDNARQRFVYSPMSKGQKQTNTDLVWLPVYDAGNSVPATDAIVSPGSGNPGLRPRAGSAANPAAQPTTLKLAWNVRVTSPDGLQDWMVRVDAQTGDVLEKTNLVVSEAPTTPGNQDDHANPGLSGHEATDCRGTLVASAPTAAGLLTMLNEAVPRAFSTAPSAAVPITPTLVLGRPASTLHAVATRISAFAQTGYPAVNSAVTDQETAFTATASQSAAAPLGQTAVYGKIASAPFGQTTVSAKTAASATATDHQTAGASILADQAPIPFFAAPAVTSAGYRVYPFPSEGANFVSRSVDNNPWLKAGSGNNAISLGWHFDNTTNYEYTRGNNVWAQQDLAGTSTTTGFSDTSLTTIPSLTFDRAINSSASPTSYSNIRAGIDNLFYWNNIMHDISYQYGFDEAAGNFQTDNQGRGGIAGDYVHAFAQDGAGINNSFFSTAADGESPTMLMYQWSTGINTVFHVNAPSAVTGTDSAKESGLSFKNRLTDVGPVTGDVVLVNDPSGTTHQACGTISNAAALSGNIAMIDRGGGCSFAVKIKNAQNAGATAVVVINNVAGDPTIMGGTDTTITIPAVMISLSDGNALKANTTGLNVSMSSTGQYIDGTFDNSVISHEYTHGISTRLTGGPANAGCLSNAEQMGEGWSDYMALMVTTDWSTATLTDGALSRSIGTYVMAQPKTGPGIRKYPYSTNMTVNKWTYAMLKDSTNGEAHSIGEPWCATIWDMTWNIIQQEGIDPDLYHGTKGNNIALQLVIEAMKLQPCSPGFIDGRDAILKADSLLYGFRHKCAIWNAFARRGMGKGASQGSSASYVDQTVDFTLPSGVGVSITADKSSLSQGDNVTYTVKAYCDCSPLSGISIRDTLSSNLSYITSSGGSYTAPYVHFDGLSFTAGESKTFTIQASVTGTYSAPDTLIKDTRDPAGYTWASSATNFIFWADATTRSHSGSTSYYAADVASAQDLRLTSNDLLLDTISTLSFWHWFETDPSYDGGVVEISTDGGTNWQDLGPYMTQNGYNGSLDPTATGIPNRAAFTGSSGGSFIQTIVRLTGFAGKTAKIRFRFTSDPYVGDQGWYIDDIILTNQSGVVSVAAAYNGASLLSKTNSFTAFTPAPLAVNFLGFDARRQAQTVVLHWTVNGEIDVDKYVVERSADGIHYSSIGEAPAISGSGDKTYYFTDAQPAEGNNFYRIVEKDLDGKATISPVRLLNFSASGFSVRLSPVPTYDHAVQLDIEMENDAAVSAVLMNTVGATLKVYSLKRGVNRLDLQNLARGVYFLRVQAGRGSSEIRKILIQ